MRHPRTLDEITPQGFSPALAGQFPGVEVTRIVPGTPIKGMATRAQYHLQYDTRCGQVAGPTSLWVKGGSETHSGAQPLALANEVNLSRDVRPRLQIRCPLSYYQVIDPDTGNGIVLLEDLTLRRATFGNVAVPQSTAAAAKVLDFLAQIHARVWQKSELHEFSWLSSGGSIAEDGVIAIFLGLWSQAEALPRSAAVTPALRDKKQVRMALYRMLELARQMPVCIVHCDPHQANPSFDADGRPGHLDWATVMRSHWAFDVAYLIVGSQSVDNRRRHEREQLRYYLDQLAAFGVPAPDFDTAWLA
jgi:aminoglycoside/choline kinase family phosphotransferase